MTGMEKSTHTRAMFFFFLMQAPWVNNKTCHRKLAKLLHNTRFPWRFFVLNSLIVPTHEPLLDYRRVCVWVSGCEPWATTVPAHPCSLSLWVLMPSRHSGSGWIVSWWQWLSIATCKGITVYCERKKNTGGIAVLLVALFPTWGIRNWNKMEVKGIQIRLSLIWEVPM